MEEASAKKVATVAAERDGAQALVMALRKERLLERAFSKAEGRTGGYGRGAFFDVFKGQLGESFRLSAGKDGGDVLEPLDSQGQPVRGDDGRPLSTATAVPASSTSRARNRARAGHKAGYGTLVSVQQANAADSRLIRQAPVRLCSI